jgi:hypothetical protein
MFKVLQHALRCEFVGGIHSNVDDIFAAHEYFSIVIHFPRVILHSYRLNHLPYQSKNSEQGNKSQGYFFFGRYYASDITLRYMVPPLL